MSQLMKVKFTDQVMTPASEIIDNVANATDGSVKASYAVSTTPFERILSGSKVGYNGVMVLGSDENGLQYTEDGGATVKQSNVKESPDSEPYQMRNLHYSDRLHMWFAADSSKDISTHANSLFYSKTGKTWHRANCNYNTVYRTCFAENGGIIMLPSENDIVTVEGVEMMQIAIFSEDGINWSDVMIKAEDAQKYTGTSPTGYAASNAVVPYGENSFLVISAVNGFAWKVSFTRNSSLDLTWAYENVILRSYPATGGDSTYNTVFVLNDKIYVGNGGEDLYLVDTVNKAFVRAVTLGTIPRGAVTVGSNAYVCGYDAKIYKVTANADGTLTSEVFVTIKGADKESSYGKKAECIRYDGTNLVCFGVDYDGTRGLIYTITLDGTVTLSTAAFMSVPSALSAEDAAALAGLKAARQLPADADIAQLLAALKGQ